MHCCKYSPRAECHRCVRLHVQDKTRCKLDLIISDLYFSTYFDSISDSFIVQKKLKRIVIDVFLDLMRHLLLEIEITCNRGGSVVFIGSSIYPRNRFICTFNASCLSKHKLHNTTNVYLLTYFCQMISPEYSDENKYLFICAYLMHMYY